MVLVLEVHVRAWVVAFRFVYWRLLKLSWVLNHVSLFLINFWHLLLRWCLCNPCLNFAWIYFQWLTLGYLNIKLILQWIFTTRWTSDFHPFLEHLLLLILVYRIVFLRFFLIRAAAAFIKWFWRASSLVLFESLHLSIVLITITWGGILWLFLCIHENLHIS